MVECLEQGGNHWGVRGQDPIKIFIDLPILDRTFYIGGRFNSVTLQIIGQVFFPIIRRAFIFQIFSLKWDYIKISFSSIHQI